MSNDNIPTNGTPREERQSRLTMFEAYKIYGFLLVFLGPGIPIIVGLWRWATG
jgi:hypothetical protein